MCMSEKAFYYKISLKDFQTYFTPFLEPDVKETALQQEESIQNRLNLYKHKNPFIKP